MMEKTKNNLRYSVAAGLALALLLSASPSQAEFYKWADESGQVHYTQTPPPKQQAEKIKVDTGTPTPAAIPLEAKSDGPKVCGTLTLPKKRLDAVTNIAMYRNAIRVWQKYIDENEKKSDEASRQGVTDRRCAIAYANKELQSLSDVESRLINNYDSVRDELTDLEQQVAQCDLPTEGDDALSVEECKSQYQLRLGQLRTMLRELEARKKMLEPAE